MTQKIKYHKKWFVLHVMEGTNCIDKIKLDSSEIRPINNIVEFLRTNINEKFVVISSKLEEFLKNR